MADPKPFAGKVITVTGAARGIGFATTRFLLERDCTVAMSDVVSENLEQSYLTLKEDFPEAKLTKTVVDISKRAQVDDWIETTLSEFGRIDGCVNNAGEATANWSFNG